MTAPSIKEALERLIADIEDYERVNNLSPSPGKDVCWQSVADAKAALATLSPQAGERREAIARMLFQSFCFPGVSSYEETKAHWLNHADAVILASGLVQDEAGIRGDLIDAILTAEKMLSEHIEEFHDFDYEPHQVPQELARLDGIRHHLLGSLIDEKGEPIRSARDGGEG